SLFLCPQQIRLALSAPWLGKRAYTRWRKAQARYEPFLPLSSFWRGRALGVSGAAWPAQPQASGLARETPFIRELQIMRTSTHRNPTLFARDALAGRVAVVTGGSAGIGLATA